MPCLFPQVTVSPYPCHLSILPARLYSPLFPLRSWTLVLIFVQASGSLLITSLFEIISVGAFTSSTTGTSAARAPSAGPSSPSCYLQGLAFKHSVGYDGTKQLYGPYRVVVTRYRVIDYSGSQLVSQIAVTGMPSFLASATAVASSEGQL